MSWMQTIAGVQSAPDVKNPSVKVGNQWFVPETFTAGNKWSKGQINPEAAKAFGATQFTQTRPYQTGEAYNPNSPNQPQQLFTSANPQYGPYGQIRADQYAKPGFFSPSYSPTEGYTQSIAGYARSRNSNPFNSNSTFSPVYNPTTKGWMFNSDPSEFLSSGSNVNFIPGQGEDRWRTAVRDVGPALAVGLGGPLLGGALAGAGAGGSALQPIAATTGSGGGGTIAGGGGFGGAMGAGAGGAAAAGTAGGTGLTATAPAYGFTVGGGGAGGGGLGLSLGSGGTASGLGLSGGGAAGGAAAAGAGLSPSAFGAGASAGSGGWFSGLLANAGKQLSGIGTNAYNNPLNVVAGAGQGILQYLQGQKLEDIAREAAARGNALDQPQRKGYQDLLAQYYSGGQDITKQPMVAANLEYARRQNEASLAKQGLTGSGRALTSVGDYTNEVFQRNAMPYLDTLQGIAGFNQGPGYSGNLYGQYSGMASGANNQAFGSLVNGLTAPQPDSTRWFDHANYSQNQMTQVPGAGTYLRNA